MGASFWTNTIWYIGLGLITAIVLILTIKKSEKKWFSISFYLTILGLTFNFETIILIFFKAYEYYPYILKEPPLLYDDILAGNVFSQTSVSAAALLFVVLDLKVYWIIIISVIFGLIEESFLSLGIYSQHWYRTWMTLLLIPLFIMISKQMHVLLIQKRLWPVMYYFYILLALFPLYIVFLFWGIFLLSGIQSFNVSYLSEPILSRSILTLVHYFIISVPIMLVVINKKSIKWHSYVVGLLIFLFYLSLRLEFTIIRQGWFLIVTVISIVWVYVSVILIDKSFGGIDKVCNRINNKR